MINWSLVTSFDWDDANSEKNNAHSLLPFECEQMFFNEPLLVLADEKHSQHETRYHALGRTSEDRLLHVTFTLRNELTKIRVISARDMHKKERVVNEKT